MEKVNSKKVISRRNAGLGDLLLATAHAWYYADKTNRDLEICWAPSSYFRDNSKNVFGTIFEVPSKIGNVKIIYHNHIGFMKRFIRRLPIFPFKYLIRTLLIELVIKLLRNRVPKFVMDARIKRVKYLKDLIQNGKDVKLKTVIFNPDFNFLGKDKIKPFFDSLKLKNEYQEIIEQFTEHYFKNKFVIGVHVRYYDKSLTVSDYTKFWLEPEKSLEILKGRLEEIISRNKGKDHVVYLATNSDIVCDYIKQNVENVVTYNKDFTKIKVNWSLHHLLDENSLKDDIIEMFLLKYCNVLFRFPPAYSWFSYYGSLYADKIINE